MLFKLERRSSEVAQRPLKLHLATLARRDVTNPLCSSSEHSSALSNIFHHVGGFLTSLTRTNSYPSTMYMYHSAQVRGCRDV